MHLKEHKRKATCTPCRLWKCPAKPTAVASARGDWGVCTVGMGLEGAPEAAILGAARANGPGGRAECESSTSTPAGNRAVSASCSDWNGYGDGLCHQPGRHARVSAPRLRMATPPGRTGCTHEVIRAIVLDCSPYLLTLQGGGLAGLKRRRVGAADRIEHLFDAATALTRWDCVERVGRGSEGLVGGGAGGRPAAPQGIGTVLRHEGDGTHEANAVSYHGLPQIPILRPPESLRHAPGSRTARSMHMCCMSLPTPPPLPMLESVSAIGRCSNPDGGEGNEGMCSGYVQCRCSKDAPESAR